MNRNSKKNLPILSRLMLIKKDGGNGPVDVLATVSLEKRCQIPLRVQLWDK